MKKTPQWSRFEEVRYGPKTALVRNDVADDVAGAFFRGERCRVFCRAGRGVLLTFPCGNGRGMLRRYHRGGLIGRVLHESFLFRNRPLQEFVLHAWLEEQAFRVPPLLGICWWHRGALYQGAIATEMLAASTLHEVLSRNEALPVALLERCGQLIRHMHDLGVRHADLQVKNILVDESGPWIIDFDKARRFRTLPSLHRTRNLFRLRRSFQKQGLPPGAFEDLSRGYGDWRQPRWLSALYRIKARLSDSASRRLRHG